MSESEASLPPTTTTQQDVISASKRKVNLIWEVTQALIALIVASAVVYCAVQKIEDAEIKNAFFLIVGFYFARQQQDTHSPPQQN